MRAARSRCTTSAAVRAAGTGAAVSDGVLAHGAQLAAIERADEVAGPIDDHPVGERMSERHERGMEIRREVLGDEHVDRAVRATTEFTAPWQEFITEVAWGGVWSRPGLDRRTRSAITLAVLTALGREHEIALHVRAALRNGLAPAEIGEVLLHTSVYAGVPASNRAFAIADGVLQERDRQPTQGSEGVDAPGERR